jgi:hypothetical protein
MFRCPARGRSALGGSAPLFSGPAPRPGCPAPALDGSAGACPASMLGCPVLGPAVLPPAGSPDNRSVGGPPLGPRLLGHCPLGCPGLGRPGLGGGCIGSRVDGPMPCQSPLDQSSLGCPAGGLGGAMGRALAACPSDTGGDGSPSLVISAKYASRSKSASDASML